MENVTLVEISGEVDLYSSPQLRRKVLELTKSKTPVILIDLKNVRYMDSSGVATLIEGLKSSHQYNGRLILSGLKLEVREVFELTRLDTVFEIYADSQAALESLAA
jgi:anti-sigma B factor antagonist